MTDQTSKRKLYNGAYRAELETEVENLQTEPTENSTTSTTEAPSTPEEGSWKKRYSDLRSYNTSLTSRVKELENQLRSAQTKELKLPSTQAEIEAFAARYPDIVRHMRTLAMQELLQERQHIQTQTQEVKDNLDRMERELGYKKIMQAHPDFEDLNNSDAFHEWAQQQPKQIQDWLFDSNDPNLCIKAIDLFKAEHNFKTKAAPKKPTGADTMVRTKSPTEVPHDETKRVWKASDIGKMHPKLYEKHEAEIEKARDEGRIDFNA